MAQFTLPNFNRRYVLLPMLSVIALVATAYFTSQDRMEHVKALARSMMASQQRMQLLVELPYALSDVETSQRGYLLTGDPEYLKPYTVAKTRLAQLVRLCLRLTKIFRRNRPCGVDCDCHREEAERVGRHYKIL